MATLQELQAENTKRLAQVLGLGHYIRAARETKPEQPATTNAKAALVLCRLFPGYCPPVFTDEQLEAALLGVYRAANPSSRAESIWHYSHNGGSKAVRSCLLCFRSVSWGAKYPKTKRAIKAEAEDKARHLDELRAFLGQVMPEPVSSGAKAQGVEA